ncbi:MAG: DUF1059 domain-containing protein [Actinomycetota bacterium]|nr:DUF1059 domain-containing protein [Actinomycetota bacterium]
MYEHSCAKAGTEGCGWSTTANSEEELRAKLDAHVKKKHRVPGGTNDTIYNYLRKSPRSEATSGGAAPVTVLPRSTPKPRARIRIPDPGSTATRSRGAAAIDPWLEERDYRARAMLMTRYDGACRAAVILWPLMTAPGPQSLSLRCGKGAGCRPTRLW